MGFPPAPITVFFFVAVVVATIDGEDLHPHCGVAVISRTVESARNLVSARGSIVAQASRKAGSWAFLPHHVSAALRQGDGVSRGRVEDVGFGVRGEKHQAVAVRHWSRLRELVGPEVPLMEQRCTAPLLLLLFPHGVILLLLWCRVQLVEVDGGGSSSSSFSLGRILFCSCSCSCSSGG